jgi:hypothetical protein
MMIWRLRSKQAILPCACHGAGRLSRDRVQRPERQSNVLAVPSVERFEEQTNLPSDRTNCT